jgi:hypothetical protein
MYKKILFCLFVLPLIYATAYGENFGARNFQYDSMDNFKTAVLIDQNTGEEWVVTKGDQIGNWLVAEVTSEYIGLLQYPSDQPYPILNRIYYERKTSIITPDTNQE